jgi:hypothetical protein
MQDWPAETSQEGRCIDAMLQPLAAAAERYGDGPYSGGKVRLTTVASAVGHLVLDKYRSDIKGIVDAFQSTDTDDAGVLDLPGFIMFLGAAGHVVSDEEASEAYEQLDGPVHGGLTLDDILNAFSKEEQDDSC